MIEAIINRDAANGTFLTRLLGELLAENPDHRPTAKDVYRRCEAARQQAGDGATEATVPAAAGAAVASADVDVQLRIEARASMQPVALMSLVTKCITESLPGANIAQLTCFTSASGTPTVDVGLNLPTRATTPGRESDGQRAEAERNVVQRLLMNVDVVSANLVKGTHTPSARRVSSQAEDDKASLAPVGAAAAAATAAAAAAAVAATAAAAAAAAATAAAAVAVGMATKIK
jgi:hypothetical protein